MEALNDIRDASSYDPTLAFDNASEILLSKKYLAPQHYTPEKLFESMYEGR